MWRKKPISVKDPEDEVGVKSKEGMDKPEKRGQKEGYLICATSAQSRTNMGRSESNILRERRAGAGEGASSAPPAPARYYAAATQSYL
ncbi:hypothetical protein EVAR_49915_1 [Eumeta japonica]|uniref:Uncharacterized protein n=1 Tax=Eumeta variegata TaxID=151549 RepID=A0A4C1Y2P7_EUMVA|nr:hypothetical protein EVAR_49915_1 [Eumeta japonica]